MPELASDAVDPLIDHLVALPPVEVVYTDLDGTLLGRGGSVLRDADGRPSLRAAGALVAAAEEGIAVVAVSGRRAADLRHDARLLWLDGAIAEVGTVVIRGGAQHHRWGGCPRDLADTPREALRVAGALDVLLAAFDGDIRPFEPWDAGREGGHLLHGRIDVAAADAALEAAGLGWAHVLDNGRAGGWEGRADVHAYHLVARGTGKAAALAEDLAERRLTRDQALAVGDSVEDLTMAGEVGTYVIVANGHGEEGAGCVRVPGRNGDGVADAIDAVLAARRLRPDLRSRG